MSGLARNRSDSAGAPWPDGVVGDCFPVRIGLADRLWNDLLAYVPGADWTSLRHCVFVMLKPDCFVRRAHRATWERLSRLGATPLHVVRVEPDPGRWERLYQWNLSTLNPQNMVGSWWLTASVLNAGPSVAALLALPEAAMSPAARIAAVKGPSDPYKASKGQLRHDLRATNVAMNLVHSSDDPLSAAHEFLLFAEPADLRSALDAVERLAADDRTRRHHRALALLDDVANEYPTCDVDPVATLVALKEQVRATADNAVCVATERCYEAYAGIAAGHQSPTGRWLAFCAVAQHERAALHALSCADEATSLMTLLATPAGWGPKTVDEVLSVTHRLGFSVATWPRLVLETTWHYAERLPSLTEGAVACAE